MDNRHYYQIEVWDTDNGVIVEQHEAEDDEELGDKFAALVTLGTLDSSDRRLEVRRMTHLDAPLTDEEQQDIENWVEGLDSDDGPEPSAEPDDIEAIDLTHPEEQNWMLANIPDEGDHLLDPESPDKFGDGVVEVQEVANDCAAGYYINGDETVADRNPVHPKEDVVVVATYVDGSDKEYAFPLMRLEEL